MIKNSTSLPSFKGVIDSTLREGMQFHHANFSLADQIRIVGLLSKIKVDIIQLGNPVNPAVFKEIQELLQIPHHSKIVSLVRNRMTDIEAALKVGVQGVDILCTVDEERITGMKSTLSDYRKLLEHHIALVKKRGLEVKVTLEDYFNQPAENVRPFYEIANDLKVDRICVADTLGKALNWEIYEKLLNLRETITVDIEGHLHNDLGNAVSNAIWAYRAGANYVTTTLLGIGERTGITSLGQLLTNLYILDPALVKKYDLTYLTQAENTVAEICEIDMPFNLITNTETAFSHKAGIHLNAVLRHGPHKYEPFEPKVIGNKRTLVGGSKVSGGISAEQIKQFYDEYGN